MRTTGTRRGPVITGISRGPLPVYVATVTDLTVAGDKHGDPAHGGW